MQIENLLVRSLVLWRLHRYVNLLLVRARTCPFFPFERIHICVTTARYAIMRRTVR